MKNEHDILDLYKDPYSNNDTPSEDCDYMDDSIAYYESEGVSSKIEKRADKVFKRERETGKDKESKPKSTDNPGINAFKKELMLLKKKYALTNVEIANRFGVSESSIRNFLNTKSSLPPKNKIPQFHDMLIQFSHELMQKKTGFNDKALEDPSATIRELVNLGVSISAISYQLSVSEGYLNKVKNGKKQGSKSLHRRLIDLYNSKCPEYNLRSIHKKLYRSFSQQIQKEGTLEADPQKWKAYRHFEEFVCQKLFVELCEEKYKVLTIPMYSPDKGNLKQSMERSLEKIIEEGLTKFDFSD